MDDGVAGVPVQKGGDTMDLAIDGLCRFCSHPSFTFFLHKESSQW